MILFCLLTLLLLESCWSVAIFTVASTKDTMYVDEWIDYHRLLGFSHIYLLDTVQPHMYSDLPKIHNNVVTVLVSPDGSFNQLMLSYQQFSQLFNDSSEICTFLSISDYIVLNNYNTIQDLMYEHGDSVLGYIPSFEAISNEVEFHPQSFLKKFTLRRNKSTSMRYSTQLSKFNIDHRYTSDTSFPVNVVDKTPIFVLSSVLSSLREQQWYVEWLCEDMNRIVLTYDDRNYDTICSYRNDTNWETIFSDYYHTIRSTYLVEGSLIPDTKAWDTFQHLIRPARFKPVDNAYNDNEDLFHEIIIGDTPLVPASDILLQLPYRLTVGGIPGRRTVLTVYRERSIPLQIVQFCVDDVIDPGDCANIMTNAISLINKELESRHNGPNVIVDQNLATQIMTYYTSLYHMFAPSPFEIARRASFELVKNAHPEECFRGWRKGETMLTRQPLIMYVINHDDASEQLIYNKVFRSSESNGILIPTRIRTTVFFEYIAYSDIFPHLYHSQWSRLDYVGITTYKTLVNYTNLCTYEVERLLEVAIKNDYDVVPFIRSKHDLMMRSVLNHGRAYRYAWDAVLLELGYNVTTIRQYDRLKPFYRSSMLIKPAWLKKLSEFMTRAINIVLFNSTLYELCSADAKYAGNSEVSQRIYGTASYQLFPFIFERLPSFYLLSEGANVCLGGDDCPFNTFWTIGKFLVISHIAIEFSEEFKKGNSDLVSMKLLWLLCLLSNFVWSFDVLLPWTISDSKVCSVTKKNSQNSLLMDRHCTVQRVLYNNELTESHNLYSMNSPNNFHDHMYFKVSIVLKFHITSVLPFYIARDTRETSYNSDIEILLNNESLMTISVPLQIDLADTGQVTISTPDWTYEYVYIQIPISLPTTVLSISSLSNSSSYEIVDGYIEVKDIKIEYVDQPKKLSLNLTLHSPIETEVFPKENCRLVGTSHSKLLDNIIIESVDSIDVRPRVLCVIYTIKKKHNNVKAIRDTWGRKCSGFLVFSDVNDPSIPTIHIPHLGEESYFNMWQKVRSILKYVHLHYVNEYDYFLIGGDDMYYIMENLYSYLSSEEIVRRKLLGKGMYIGRIYAEEGVDKVVYNTGGPGYLLDDIAMKVLVGQVLDNCSRTLKRSMEDILVGFCLRGLSEIVPYDTKDEFNRQRWHNFPPGVLYDPEVEKTESMMGALRFDIHLKYGLDCCSQNSIAFHYIPEDLMYQIDNYLYKCNKM